jgi:phosphate:Na+ symporter
MILDIVFKLVGALGMFLFGMKLLSEGVQRASGQGLRKALNAMTNNRFSAVLSGFGVTSIVQSSSATTVMVVSFVNAGLLSLSQSIGVIMGANIGTTVTAWIVSLLGFSFKISAMALPAIGAGFFLAMYKRLGDRTNNWGQALLGFGLLFLGLEYLSGAVPRPDPATLDFLAHLKDYGLGGVLLGVLAGTVVTMLVHSSSASTAIAITLAVKGVLDFPTSAAIIVGCNIGTTIDAFIASIGTTVSARRAAWVHILFNCFGSLVAVILFGPFLALVDFLVPGSPEINIATHIAMLHTVFNVANTALLLPFTGQIARIVSAIVRPHKGEAEGGELPIRYLPVPFHEMPEMNLLAARKEAIQMAGKLKEMFSLFKEGLSGGDAEDAEGLEQRADRLSEYCSEMREGLASFLHRLSQQKLSERGALEAAALMRIVGEMREAITASYGLFKLARKLVERKVKLGKHAAQELEAYALVVEEFIEFATGKMAGSLAEADSAEAERLEDRIDELRNSLRKASRKRIESGADVKAELFFIDMVRALERLGDNAYAICMDLRLL